MRNRRQTTHRYPETPRPAVGAVVFKDRTVLLVKRGNPPSQGTWAIPGGRIRLGETLQAAAEREILEETGVVIHAGDDALDARWIPESELTRLAVNPATRRLLLNKYGFGK